MSDHRPEQSLTRRELLAAAANAAALATLAPAGRAARAAGHEPVWDCLVLGAGIAGVTAARDLRRRGFRVLVLEGSERIGGRMFSIPSFTCDPGQPGEAACYPLEAGAEYVHIGDQNRYPEFFAELESHGFTRRKYPKFTRNRLAFPEWRKSPKKLLKSLLRETNLIPTVTLLSDVDDYDRQEDMPAGQFVARKKYKGKGLRLGRYTVSSHTPGQLYDPAIDVFEPPGIASCARPPGPVVDTISVAGMRADQLPKQLFYETSEYKMERRRADGNSEPCGYDELPKAIAAELSSAGAVADGPPGEILLGHRVVRVERAGDGVAVTTETAAGEPRVFRGRSAVSTFSVGMLDPAGGEGERIFGDLLTADKREALLSIRMGAITKFSLEFNKSHWGRKAKMTVMSHPKGCARTFFSAYPDRRRGPFVLTGLLMNQDHEIVKGLDDEAAVQHLLDVLQSAMSRRGPRWTPERVLVTRPDGRPNFNRQDWQRDPFARGGNSYLAYRPEVDAAGVGRLRDRLRDPRETLPLFWAGEATAPAYDRRYQPLAVHGAYISGVGAARDVADFLRPPPAEAGLFVQDYGAKQEAMFAAAAEPAPAPIEIALAADEAAALERYRAERAHDSLERAARELYRIGIFQQENDPKRIRVREPAATSRTLSLTLTADELARVERYAATYAEGDVGLALRGLVLRQLD